jgi:hypothetical protein
VLDPDAPIGGEADFKVLEHVGTPRKFDFEPKDHVELGKLLDEDGRLQLSLDVMGMAIESDVEILPAELVVRLEVPGMAGLFAGKIKSGIQERLGGLLEAGSA